MYNANYLPRKARRPLNFHRTLRNYRSKKIPIRMNRDFKFLTYLNSFEDFDGKAFFNTI